MAALKNYLKNLNVFAPPPGTNEQDDEQQRQWNIIATRVYLSSLILILFGIGLAFWYITQTTIITVTHPTREQFENLPINAKCLCSQISIPYGKFTSLETRFYQVCSSAFVSDRWLRAINSGVNSTYFNVDDFRAYGSAQFQALAAFCRLSQVNVNQNIASFSLNTLLSPEVLPESVLRSQSQASIAQFQSTAPAAFKSQLRLVNRMAMYNRLTSGLGTNIFYKYIILADNTLDCLPYTVRYLQDDGSRCLCDVDLCSYTPSGFETLTSQPSQVSINVIPGFSSGCLPVTSMLVSTLECIYNQTCVDTLISYFPTSESFTAMTIDEVSHYNQTSTVQFMVDNLMIEEWTMNISYDEYYSQCAPLSCTYSEVSRHDFLFILTKLISLLSGLTLILELFIPYVVQFIGRLKSPAPTPTPRVSLCVRLRQLKALVQTKLVELNTFKHYPSTDRQIRYQRNATRLYILLVICSLIVLIVYTSTDTQLQSKTVLHPTLSQYLQLEQDYSQTLSCSCTSITQSYSTFITIQPHYHQLCSSDLVSQQWIKYIQQHQNSVVAGIFIFNYWNDAPPQFQSLSMFCQQAQQTVDDALTVFMQIHFVSAQIVSQASFEVQITSLIEAWKSTTTNTFMRTIQLIRTTTQGNRLLTGLYNSEVQINGITYKGSIVGQTYVNCSCALSQSCYIAIGIYSDQKLEVSSAIYWIPNFLIGCYPIEALFVSTLECFYNMSCILEIDSYLNSSISFNFSALDPDLSWANETIESIVNRLMIDTWSSTVSFPSYYDACAPSSCSFQYVDRSSLLIIITTIIGIFGGASLGFQLIITIVLQFIDKIVQNGISRRAALNSIKHMFTCPTEHQLRHRLHFILLVVILCILYAYSALTPHTRTIQVDKPSLSIYKNLLTQSYDSLQCPCSQIAIKYKTFLNIQPRFHEVCSSDFVSDQWFTYLYQWKQSVSAYSPSDFLYSASEQFQLLTSFCRLSQQTANNSLLELGISDFINTQLLSPSSLNDRIQTKINEFQQTMPQSFVNSLSLIRETTGVNMLMNILSTSWMLARPHYITNRQPIPTVPLEYDGCDCSLSSRCVSPSRGMLSGCYPMESILQSTLECLYDQQCIDSKNTFQAMNISSLESSRFPMNATVESIVNELMVEELLSNVPYELYFDECTPTSCVYSYVGHNNLLQGVTTLISLYGGLMIICRVLAIVIVQVYVSRRQTVAPVVD